MLDCKLPGYCERTYSPSTSCGRHLPVFPADCSVTRIIEYTPPLSQKAGPGQWNDLDMLEVGNGGMTHDEYSIISYFNWIMPIFTLI